MRSCLQNTNRSRSRWHMEHAYAMIIINPCQSDYNSCIKRHGHNHMHTNIYKVIRLKDKSMWAINKVVIEWQYKVTHWMWIDITIYLHVCFVTIRQNPPSASANVIANRKCYFISCLTSSHSNEYVEKFFIELSKNELAHFGNDRTMYPGGGGETFPLILIVM